MKKIIVANWKCNPVSLKKAERLFNLVKRGIKNIKSLEIVICPPFPYLSHFLCDLKKCNIKLGAQDCFWEERGAFTGQVSAKMLKNLGCDYVIVGHSERKALGETDEIINKKLRAAIKSKLKSILCIGETEEERKKGKTFKVLKKQIQSALNFPKYKLQNTEYLIVAYEPIWAIGTGRPCEISEAKKVCLFLKKIFKRIPILYGGSVNSKIAADYIKDANFDGLLVGGASLKAKEFIKIVKSITSY